MDLVLSENQFDLVYNSFSFVIASMGAAFIFFLLVRSKVAPRHRMAVTLSTLVVAIAAIGIIAMLLTMASAIRHGLSVIALERRVLELRENHRRQLVERGLLAPEPDDIAEVEIIEDAPPGEDTLPQRRAA